MSKYKFTYIIYYYVFFFNNSNAEYEKSFFDFKINSIDGNEINFSEYKGKSFY